jgi:hypothetical protein
MPEQERGRACDARRPCCYSRGRMRMSAQMNGAERSREGSGEPARPSLPRACLTACASAPASGPSVTSGSPASLERKADRVDFTAI